VQVNEVADGKRVAVFLSAIGRKTGFRKRYHYT